MFWKPDTRNVIKWIYLLSFIYYYRLLAKVGNSNTHLPSPTSWLAFESFKKQLGTIQFCPRWLVFKFQTCFFYNNKKKNIPLCLGIKTAVAFVVWAANKISASLFKTSNVFIESGINQRANFTDLKQLNFNLRFN